MANSLTEQTQYIIKHTKRIIETASKGLNESAKQELKDDIGFYVIHQLEKLQCPICTDATQVYVGKIDPHLFKI